MKVTRIFLFLSPLLLLLPPLLPLGSSVAWSMLGMFYGLILRHFPWNLGMAFLCYTYAQHLGRDGFLWAGSSFFFPFLAPVILGFVPPKWNSPAERRKGSMPVAAKGIVGTFGERFPLLEAHLEGKAEPVRALLVARFMPIEANYEFWLTANPAELARMNAQATERNFALWSDPGEVEMHLYGAGLVQKEEIDQMAAWMRSGSMAGEKISAKWRDKDGAVKLLEYYSV